MSEAFECYICRKVMALFGADASRCPGCGSVHGKLIAKHHVGGTPKARSPGARIRRRATKR
jgi:ribosomal protein L40E